MVFGEDPHEPTWFLYCRDVLFCILSFMFTLCNRTHCVSHIQHWPHSPGQPESVRLPFLVALDDRTSVDTSEDFKHFLAR